MTRAGHGPGSVTCSRSRRRRRISPYSLGIFDGRAGIWAAVCENPDADQLEWGIPRRIADGEYVNKPVILRDGGWLLSATLFPRKCIGIRMGDMKESDLFRELDSLRRSNFFVSKDQGATWERRGGVTAPPDAWDWDEPHFIEKSSGELRCLLRTNYGLCESRSTDGARTWSPPKPSKLVHPASRLFTMKLQSGKVLLVKHGRLEDKASRIRIVYDQERLNGRIVMATLREKDVRAGKPIRRDASLKTPVYQAPSGPTPADRSR